jgi:tetratricopeptide (TPR) repeat protein
MGFSLGLFLVSLFLFSNIIFSIPNIISERWLLLPSLGICLLLAQLWQLLYRYSRITGIVTLSLICFGFSGYTWQRNSHWKNNLTLARVDIKTAPTNYNITRMMASELHFAAQANGMDSELLKESAYYYRQMLRAIPEDYYTRNNLGLIYEELGQHAMAALEFSKVIVYDSEIKETVKYSYAKNQCLAGNYMKALEMLNQLEIDYPNNAGVKELKATSLKSLGREEEAHTLFSKVLSLEPNNAEANQHFAKYYLEQAKANHGDEALMLKSAERYEIWLMQTPDKPEEHNTLGQIYEHLGKYDAAAQHFSKAASQPSAIQGKAAFSAAKNLSLAGDDEAALDAWTELYSTYPNVPEVAFNKAETLKKLGKYELALEAYHHTLEIISSIPQEDRMRYQELIKQAKTATSKN